MKENFSKLINLKSIVTLVLTIVFCVLSLKNVLNGEQFLMIYTTVIAFYFGTQYEKNKNKNEEVK